MHSEQDEQPERQLAESLRRGDPGAAEALHQEYLDRVYGYLARRVTRREDAEDLTCEVFSAALQCSRSLRGDFGVVPWLFGIARRKLADHLRRGVRREVPEAELPVDGPSPLAGVDLALELSDELLHQQEVVQAVRRAMGRLHPAQREALLLQHADGLSLREIGQVMGRSEDGVKALLRRGRAALAEELVGSDLVGDQKEVKPCDGVQAGQRRCSERGG